MFSRLNKLKAYSWFKNVNKVVKMNRIQLKLMKNHFKKRYCMKYLKMIADLDW